jgi:hypothetical protein
LRDHPQRRVDKAFHALDKLRRRENRPRLFVELQEFDDLGDVLGEDELVAARQNGNRACAQALQLGPAGRISEDIDRFELDPTDREKLFESQAAGSTRLPERLQRRRFRHSSPRSQYCTMFDPAHRSVNPPKPRIRRARKIPDRR